MFTNTDGNMYVQVEVHNETAEALPCNVVSTCLIILYRCCVGGPWPNGVNRFAELHSDADGPYVAQPRFFAGESIPDGLGGASRMELYFPGHKGGEKPHMKPALHVSSVGQFDYTLPMPAGALIRPLYGRKHGVREEDTLYAINSMHS